MLNELENYRFEGQMQRTALTNLRTAPTLTGKQIDELNSAYKYGKWLTIGIQSPVIALTAYYFGKYVPKYSAERKMITYTFAIGIYGMFYMYSKAWAWHQAFAKVEPLVKDYILTTDIEDLKKLNEPPSSTPSIPPKP